VTDVQAMFRRAAGRALRSIAGPPRLPVFDRLARADRRWSTFVDAVEYINYEAVPGDIVEFGVYTGISLALLAKSYSFDSKGMSRRVAGFDAFNGLPDSREPHARWKAGDCSSSHGWHPLLSEGDPVTSQVTLDLFAACGLPAPILHIGPFEQTLSHAIPAEHPQIALAHFDCDLYESTHVALENIAPALQDGTVLLFDDWFHYKGHPGKGEARAFGEFLAAHPEWGAVQYRTYATFCNAFILHRR
jgi:hypothetical protein